MVCFSGSSFFSVSAIIDTRLSRWLTLFLNFCNKSVHVIGFRIKYRRTSSMIPSTLSPCTFCFFFTWPISAFSSLCLNLSPFDDWLPLVLLSSFDVVAVFFTSIDESEISGLIFGCFEVWLLVWEFLLFWINNADFESSKSEFSESKSDSEISESFATKKIKQLD